MKSELALNEYRLSAAIERATPGEVLDAVVRSLDEALKRTKATQSGID